MYKRQGLERSAELLSGIDDIAVVRLYNRDVVRHRLVREIVKAFEKNDEMCIRDSVKSSATNIEKERTFALMNHNSLTNFVIIGVFSTGL